ncbi:ribonuclease domain-containing protein [Corynebacterium ulceribovis]|uniref:ribonuclease domain-containing protein n=1 Tax=Corynebacterium ulceribovis TaxID=487732 RepID=UPI000360770B|nr:ribonuclease domain-containing protein [Corynebacterium ulceribovis]
MAPRGTEHPTPHNGSTSKSGGFLKKSGGAAAVILALLAAAFGTQQATSHDADNADQANTAESSASSATSSTARKPGPKPSTSPKVHPSNADDGVCPLVELPAEAEVKIEGILAGDPMISPEDGKHFGNYEGLLPKEKSSYYREYTVQKPGLNHRGPWRIVVGGGTKTDPDTWYFTFDHFETFCEITDAEG